MDGVVGRDQVTADGGHPVDTTFLTKPLEGWKRITVQLRDRHPVSNGGCFCLLMWRRHLVLVLSGPKNTQGVECNIFRVVSHKHIGTGLGQPGFRGVVVLKFSGNQVYAGTAVKRVNDR